MKIKIILSISILILISCKIETQKPVKFKFVKKIEISQNFQYPTLLLSSKEQLNHIFNQNHKPLYKLRDYIDYDRYDFKKYDYLFSFGKEIIKIEPTEDDCDYLTKEPIKFKYLEPIDKNYIFIYVIDKNKYRNFCP